MRGHAPSIGSVELRSAVRRWLPKARVAVDHFHLVKLGNDMLTTVRRRVSWDRHDRRGRKTDPAWAHRLLLLRGYNTLSEAGKAKLEKVLRTDDPTEEIGAAWGIKEALRLVLMAPTVAVARQQLEHRLETAHGADVGTGAENDLPSSCVDRVGFVLVE